MKLHIIKGPALSGKTNILAREMEQAHRENPLSYTFLGPTGEFVKELSEWFSRLLHSSIPRSSFMVIDQFADDVYGHAHHEMIYADKHLLKVFIANILGSATQKELGPFYPLKDSLGLIGFVAEAVMQAKDDGVAALMARLANDQARSIVQFALRELEVGYGANLYDTFDAYVKIDVEEIRDYVASRFSKSLFLDGFTNLSWAQMIFLSKIIPHFQETFMTLDPIYADKDSWSKFLELLAAKSVEILEEELASSAKATLPMERLLSDQGPPGEA